MCEKIWQNKFKISEGHFHVYLVVNNICRHEIILYSPQVIVHSTWLNRKLNFCQLICLTTVICNAGLSPGSLLCSIFKTVFVISLQKEGLVYLYSIKTKCRFEAEFRGKKGLYLDKCSYVDHEGLCSRYNKLVHTSYGMRSANNVKNINNHHLVQNAIK